MYPFTAYQGAETLYIYDMDLWSTPSGVWGSTMYNHIRQVSPHPKIPENWPSTQWGHQAKGGAIYPFTAYQGAETLYIYMIWICEALQVGFEAQPWCNYIRQVSPHPKIPENLP